MQSQLKFYGHFPPALFPPLSLPPSNPPHFLGDVSSSRRVRATRFRNEMASLCKLFSASALHSSLQLDLARGTRWNTLGTSWEHGGTFGAVSQRGFAMYVDGDRSFPRIPIALIAIFSLQRLIFFITALISRVRSKSIRFFFILVVPMSPRS